MNTDNFDTEKFIKEIEIRPSLWDVTMATYFNREIKNQCWEELIDIFSGKDLAASERRESGLLLQKKWKSIRGCFTRELRRQESLMSGNSLGARKTEYTHFQQVQFLLKVVKSRDNSEESLGYIYYDVPEINIKKEETDSDDPLREDNTAIPEDKPKRVKYLYSRENDEDRMFLLSMVSALQSVPRDKKISTKIKLMTVLDDATKGLDGLEET